MSKIILVFVVLFLQACGSKSTNLPEQLPDDTKARGNNSSQPEQAIVVLDRRSGQCDKCPVYTISIDDTGKVVFEGKENVKTKGSVESKIEKSRLEELIQLFENSQFSKLNDKYDRGENCSTPILSDSPYAFISFSDGKTVKSVRHYLGCVETTNLRESVNKDLNVLFKLEESVDKFVNSKQWIK